MLFRSQAPELPRGEESKEPVQTGPIQHQGRLGEDVVLQLVASYLDGTTIRELAEQFDINEKTAHSHLKRLGVRRPYRKVKPLQVNEAVQLYQSGQSLNDVADHLGVSVDTTRRLLIEAGVQIRRR